MENHVKYQEATYFKSDDDSTLYVGLYLPTTLDWSDKGLTVSQQTSFPSETSTISVAGDSTQKFTLKLRVPSWCTSGFSITKNGQPVAVNAEPNSYVSVAGVGAGDSITVNMPYSFHLDYAPDTLDGSNVASVMYGPWVMCAQNSSTDYLNLFLQTDLNRSISVVGLDDRKLPIILTNGCTMYAMPSKVLSSNPYHAYFQISSDNGDA